MNNPVISREWVQLFIDQFKECFENGNTTGDYSKKTTDFLREIHWNYKAMCQFVIENIKCRDYYRGPSPHHRNTHATVMEFGMTLSLSDAENRTIYVKLELIYSGKEATAGYMSFHPAERAIEYPFR